MKPTQTPHQEPKISPAGALRLFAEMLIQEMKENAVLRAKLDKLKIANIRKISRIGGGV